MIRKILLAAAAAALMSTPAWGLPGQAPGKDNGQGQSTTTSTDPGHSGDRHGKGKGKGNHGQDHHGAPHKCMVHSVGYVASGTLASWTLTKNSDGSYSGEVTVEVSRTNRHARADKGKTVGYPVTNVQVTFGLSDTNKDGTVGLDDLAKDDRVHVIGKITALAKKCNQSGFTAVTRIRRIVFHAPAGS